MLGIPSGSFRTRCCRGKRIVGSSEINFKSMEIINAT